MRIGDVVYVVWKATLSSSYVAVEALVVGEPRKNGWRGVIFRAEQLRTFSLQEGWKDALDSKSYTYRIKDTYSSKEAALIALQQIHKEVLKSLEQSIQQAQDALKRAQNNLIYCLNQEENLRKLDLPLLFDERKEKYISIFTGNEI